MSDSQKPQMPASAPVSSRKTQQTRARWCLNMLVDRSTMALPLLLMAVLAGATYWLVRHTPTLNTVVKKGPARHIADYRMDGFQVYQFTPQGQAKAELAGTQMRHFPDNDTIEIDQVKMRAIDPNNGRRTQATAKLAMSDGKGTVVTLLGDARVQRTSGANDLGKNAKPMEFAGEQLQVNTETQKVYSNQPVELKQGAMVVNANSLQYDHPSDTLQLDGRVHGTLPSATQP